MHGRGGKEITVASCEGYSLITHMKLNRYATQSHIVLQGYNESSKSWYQIM
jgi:hypothetical protein